MLKKSRSTSKKVLILGGGIQQKPLVELARKRGFFVYISDYYRTFPCKSLAHRTKRISTFSIPDNLKYAKRHKIDFVLTSGTDQPVLTAAVVSQELGLPHPITGDQGRMVTNKAAMKIVMQGNGIPTPQYVSSSLPEGIVLDGLMFPLVIKPADSQGQRGISLLDGNEHADVVREKLAHAFVHSSTRSVLVEEYYPGRELTVNCWVEDGEPFSLLTTDRLHFDDECILGISKQHRYPCDALKSESDAEELRFLLSRIVRAFGIKRGPLYIQMICGDQGIKVIELGFRVGGGFEAHFIPHMTGIDVTELYLDLTTGGKYRFNGRDIFVRFPYGSICFVFSRPGTVRKIEFPSKLISHGQLFVKKDQTIGPLRDATSRIGYFIVTGNDFEDYKRRLAEADEGVHLIDASGNDLVYHGIYE
jgi:phosphoribosylamine-glycine ligase